MRLQHQAFNVSVDYRQFYLWDRGMTDQAPEEYTHDDVTRRIKVGPHVVVIQPERNGIVPVEIESHDADPGFDLSVWDHVAEASLHLSTGQLQVHECIGGPVAEIQVEPGWYRVRSHHGGLVNLEKSEPGSDHYRAVLWPAVPEDVRIVKQWAPASEATA